MDVLEYLHSCGYVHADLKPANILLESTKGTANKQCYLVDFGLACRYTTEKVYKPNPKKAHDGTIEYLSRDAHQGGKLPHSKCLKKLRVCFKFKLDEEIWRCWPTI